jgi:hypothetical protein
VKLEPRVTFAGGDNFIVTIGSKNFAVSGSLAQVGTFYS